MKTSKTPAKIAEAKRLREIAKEIRRRANLSLAILGMGAVWRGSGHFLNIRPSSESR